MFPTIFQRNDAIKRFSQGNDKKERMLESGWEQSRIDHWVDQNETRCDTLILEKKRNNKTGYRKRHGERRQFILGWYTRKRGIATIFHLSAIYSHSGRVSRLLLPFSFPLSRDTCLEFFKRGKNSTKSSRQKYERRTPRSRFFFSLEKIILRAYETLRKFEENVSCWFRFIQL